MSFLASAPARHIKHLALLSLLVILWKPALRYGFKPHRWTKSGIITCHYSFDIEIRSTVMQFSLKQVNNYLLKHFTVELCEQKCALYSTWAVSIKPSIASTVWDVLCIFHPFEFVVTQSGGSVDTMGTTSASDILLPKTFSTLFKVITK